MRKLLITLLVFATASASVDIDQKIKQVRQQAFEEGYRKGMLECEIKNRDKWIKEGERRILRRLELYGELLDRIFNYRILLKNGKILPPQVALICDRPQVKPDEMGGMNCRYRIVANARFVNPEDFTFKSLIAEGKIEEMVKPVERKPLIDRVYVVGVFDYEAGLEVVKKLYDMGLRTIQRNVNGKLVVAVFEGKLTAEKKAVLREEFNLKPMTLEEFMASRFIVRERKKPEKPKEPIRYESRERYRFTPASYTRPQIKRIGEVVSYGLRIRQLPSVHAKTVGWLRKGDRVEIIDVVVTKKGRFWYRVRAKGKEGFVYAKYVRGVN